MGSFKVGDRFESIHNPNKRGTIKRFETNSGGQNYYSVRYDGSNSNQLVVESDIRVEKRLDDPWDKLTGGVLLNYQDFSVTTTYFKVKNNADNTISTLKASRTLFQPHQFKPLIKFLESQAKRILIADEVGLGKTIEAGHILLEMVSRKQVDNALVICPKSLQEKWQDELRDKFGFDFKIFSTKELAQDLKRDQKFTRKSIYGIITYDKLKNDAIQEVLVKSPYSFDFIICDEAHLLRNSSTQRHKAIKPIVEDAKFVNFLTATPLCNNREDLFNLLQILDPERYYNYTFFLNDLEANRPFVKALNAVNNGQSFHEILSNLEKDNITEYFRHGEEEIRDTVKLTDMFKSDPLLKRVVDRLANEDETNENRVLIQRDLIELNTLSQMFTRTKKRDVIENRIVRAPHDIRVSFTPEEMREYIKVEEAVKSGYSNDRAATFALISKHRQLTSSILAYYSEMEELEQGNYKNHLPDSKFKKLKSIVESVVIDGENKLIIFAFYRKTIRYLKARLTEMGVGCHFMDGSTDNRFEMIEQFKTDSDFQVLISGSIGQEGLDMQFCDAIVNYDLPWNPMKIEQRIGRIDRIGQAADKVHIYNLVIHNTIEEKIYNRLLKKIKIFEESLGDLESILMEGDSNKLNFDQLEFELYNPELTESQQEQRIESTARAAIQERENLEDIENELTQTLVNDFYLNNEIKRIRDNKRYVTEQELKDYINALIREKLQIFDLNPTENGTWLLTLPSDGSRLLFEFIENYLSRELKNSGNNAINAGLYEFKKQFYGQREIELTFDQEQSFENKNLAFINSYHPLILAATSYFKETGRNFNNTYNFSLDSGKIDDKFDIRSGHYLLALNRIIIKRTFNNEQRSFNYLFPVIANINTDPLTFLNNDVSEHIYGLANTEAKTIKEPLDFSEPGLKDLIVEVRPQVSKRLINEKNQKQHEEDERLTSLVDRISKQTAYHYDHEINSRKQRLKEGRGIEEILKSEIEKKKQEKEEKINRLKKSFVESEMEPISVSHLHII
jgi:SNF2 family DNA or RNA helicase